MELIETRYRKIYDTLTNCSLLIPANVAHLGPTTTGQLVTPLLFDKGSFAFVANSQQGCRHLFFGLETQRFLIFILKLFARNTAMSFPILIALDACRLHALRVHALIKGANKT